MPIEKKHISNVKVNKQFSDISKNEYGIDPYDYSHELAKLTIKWKQDGYVEIYSAPEKAAYAQAKSSELNEKGNFIYQYCDVFHCRIIDGKYDPLAVLKFTKDPNNSLDEYVSLRFIADHEQLFGSTSDKYNNYVLKHIRDKADKNLKNGDGQD